MRSRLSLYWFGGLRRRPAYAEATAAIDAVGEAQCAEEAASAHSGGQVCTVPHVGLMISGVYMLSGVACLLSSSFCPARCW